ncbi:hypothetical protein Tco_0713629 [Tanacetum coccineum]
MSLLYEQNECVRVELEKVKQHYKELYDSIKITRAHTREKTSTMFNEIESLKSQLKSKVSCVTSDSVKPKVLAPDMYAIDVKLIPPPLKNNRSAYLNYINHLKESIETVREIVKEDRVELLEYVIGTYPKSFNERDNKAPSTPVTRKKQVTFNDKPGTSSSNTQKHEEHQKVQHSNIPVIPSTGVNSSTEASGSKPRCNTKNNRNLPAKSVNQKTVKDHPMTNKSVWTKVNRVDSSISSKRVSLKAQLRSKEPCVTSDYVKPKVLAPGMYAIDVKPIPHPLKNNRSAHLNYVKHLKESVETVREIVEEARVVKPLDNALNYACQYTKLSQELLEYVIGTCPKSFNERDNKAPSTPVTRKKQVTFSDKPGTSSSNTQKHEVHQKVQQTNVHVIHSTGVNTSTEASGSKPRSNTKKNRILPAKSENKKKVEDHPRTNKSVWTKVNRVDSSISSKRVVINSNSESVCKTCNKCLNSANHEMCVVNILSSVNATPTVKIVLNKGKQIWKPKGKLSDNSLNKTKRVWKATGKLFADIGKKFALGELCPLTKLSVKCRTGRPLVSGLRLFKTYDGESVYYVEGLGHNLFSVGQFCDSDLEIAFRKHSCFVRDMNGVDLLKGSRSTNLYTISLDDMMKSSPVCLLSKVSKTKSWL